ncbi:unnamed protein product [Coregonus sp. 'balchen']|nr:unnamed protein product [Coregonus sp. 'balchen']
MRVEERWLSTSITCCSRGVDERQLKYEDGPQRHSPHYQGLSPDRMCLVDEMEEECLYTEEVFA